MATTENDSKTVSLSSFVDSPVEKILSTPKLLKHLTDASANLIEGTDLVRLISFTRAASQVIDSDANSEVVVNEHTYAQETFGCDKLLTDAFPIKKNVQRENRRSLVVDNSNRVLRNMGLAFDAYCQTKLLAASAHADNIVTRSASMSDDILDLQEKMTNAGVPEIGRKIALTAAHRKAALKDGILTQMQTRGDGSAISTGVITMVYGFEVIDYVPTGAISLAFTADACQWAIQGNTEISVKDENTLFKLTYVIFDKIGAFCPAQSVAGKSPFVYQLKNAA